MTVDWTRARLHAICGGCGQSVPEGAPLRVLRSGSRRCAACTKALLGEEPPAYLTEPAAPRPPRTRLPFEEDPT